MARFSSLLAVAVLLTVTGCGGGKTSFSPPPIILSVSVNNATITVPPNNMAVYVQVVIVAPTETATLNITGLPAGVSFNYRESESSPSGVLTLMATPSTLPGTYMPQINVGTLGQTASTVFSLVVTAPAKTALSFHEGPGPSLQELFLPSSEPNWVAQVSLLRPGFVDSTALSRLVPVMVTKEILPPTRRSPKTVLLCE
jgi:hypothetical protein